MRRAFAVVTLSGVLALASASRGGEEPAYDRGDLARALRRFETAWEDARATLPDERRRKVLAHVTKATFAFFSSSTEPAIAELARATAGLKTSEPAREGLVWHAGPSLVAAGDLERRVLLARPAALRATAEHSFEVALVLSGQAPLARTRLALPAVATTAEATLAARLAAGRYELRLLENGQVIEGRPLAAVDDLAARIERLRAAATKLAASPRGPTVRARLERLERAVAGTDDGVDRDLVADLEGLEADALALARGEDPYPHRAGDELRAVVREGSSIPYRLVVPASAARAPAALVIALHGVGGDEDMFAEAYGRGIVKRLALESGAIFAAPRSPGPFAMGAAHARAVIAAIEQDYTIDRIFVVGHSMGAGQALELAERPPERLRGVAFFSGPGGTPRRKIRVPCFVAAGSADFAKAGAKNFADQLRAAGVDSTYDERADLEHLVVVREAAPAAFEFLRARGLAAAKRFY